MKFGKRLASLMIPEWKDKYINYLGLKKILKRAKKLTKKKYLIKYENYTANNLSQTDLDQLRKLRREFFTRLFLEFVKFRDSFLFIYYGMISPNFVKLVVNFDILKSNASSLKQGAVIKNNIMLKNSLERFYKLIVYSKEFMNLNFRIIYKICKKFKKIFKVVGLFKDSRIIEFNHHVCESNFAKEVAEMEQIKNKTKSLYYKKLVFSAVPLLLYFCLVY